MGGGGGETMSQRGRGGGGDNVSEGAGGGGVINTGVAQIWGGGAQYKAR